VVDQNHGVGLETGKDEKFLLMGVKCVQPFPIFQIWASGPDLRCVNRVLQVLIAAVLELYD
jgi:hypothetical protein